MLRALFFILFSSAFLANAQTIGGLINSYAKVTAVNGVSFTIGTPGGKAEAALSDFDAGALVLIYQVKGVTSSATTNVSAYGEVVNYRSPASQ
ncbi:hypothetical protein N9C06_00180 [Salibacteraceae bacterium]|jgi:hypothetical protein|nr:hypothetical protein [Salibacteraceae bacterium]